MSNSAHHSFLSHAGYRYLRWSLILIVLACAAYIWHNPDPRPNGGTWLGYTLGGLSALIVFLLLYLGIRKRRYKSAMGTVKGWLSAHVWLGLSLIVLATLHSGWQIGLNIHSLAYVLMLIVIASGVWGVVMYQRNPSLMTSNRNQQTREMLYQQLLDLDTEALQLADPMGASLHQQISTALTPVSGSRYISRLRNSRWSDTIQADRDADHSEGVYRIEQQLATHISASDDPKQIDQLRYILQTLSKRRRISRQLGRDIRLQALLEIWLLAHVPLSIGLLAALISHIVAVFFYW